MHMCIFDWGFTFKRWILVRYDFLAFMARYNMVCTEWVGIGSSRAPMRPRA